jgi:hypothetical protein
MMKRLILAIVVVGAAVAFALNAWGIRDFSRFQIWALSHDREMKAAGSNALVLTHWDQWGFAGNGNDNYLVSDPANELAGALAKRTGPELADRQSKIAAGWGNAHRLNCHVVWVSRLRSGFYLITTYNCLLQNVPQSAGS